LAIVVCLGGAAAVAAAEGEPRCLADVKKFCKLVPRGLLQGCLEGHSTELSPSCRKHIGDFNHDTDALGAACRSDVARHCAGLPPAADTPESCLVAHRDALSAKCRETLESQAPEE
jgi:hypothetical protein